MKFKRPALTMPMPENVAGTLHTLAKVAEVNLTNCNNVVTPPCIAGKSCSEGLSKSVAKRNSFVQHTQRYQSHARERVGNL
jgi:hypothetical protein